MEIINELQNKLISSDGKDIDKIFLDISKKLMNNYKLKIDKCHKETS